jgi:hypothetical protein
MNKNHMKPENFYECAKTFLTLSGDPPLSKKIRSFNELLGCYENHWQIVGITEDALRRYKDYNFKKKSKQGINRSHIKPRSEIYSRLLNKELLDMGVDAWWEFFTENDKTILATSSENNLEKFSQIFKIDPKLGLFKNAGFSHKHSKQEENFLKTLYHNNINDL